MTQRLNNNKFKKQSPHELNQCPSKRDPTELTHPFYHAKKHWKNRALDELWNWFFSGIGTGPQLDFGLHNLQYCKK